MCSYTYSINVEAKLSMRQRHQQDHGSKKNEGREYEGNMLDVACVPVGKLKKQDKNKHLKEKEESFIS